MSSSRRKISRWQKRAWRSTSRRWSLFRAFHERDIGLSGSRTIIEHPFSHLRRYRTPEGDLPGLLEVDPCPMAMLLQKMQQIPTIEECQRLAVRELVGVRAVI